jgi:hypothetical protein
MPILRATFTFLSRLKNPVTEINSLLRIAWLQSMHCCVYVVLILEILAFVANDFETPLSCARRYKPDPKNVQD